MKTLKSKILALLAGVGVAYQVSRPPEMETHDKVIEIDKSPTFYGNKPEVLLTGTINAKPEEVKLINEAIKLSNTVMATECFRNAILDGKFTETNGLTNTQIYDLIASKKMSVKVQMFTGNFYQNYIAKTMGIDKGNGIVYINRFFVKDADEMASLILHEAEGHGQGFHHYDVKSTSVPYSLNSIYDKCSN